jgi:carbamoyltransferase
MDLAASIQVVTEEIVLHMAREAHRLTGQTRLVLAGGVALNCVANGRLLRAGPFADIWIQPAAGDAGGALGAALFTWHQLLENPRPPVTRDSQQGSLLGPAFANDEITRTLAAQEIPHQKFSDEAALLKEIAGLLAAGKIVGWFHGRLEFGPRALGARSILGDPRNAAMQSVMNVKIKFRESFRPFAPCVLQERAADYFVWPPGAESPYMLMVAPLLEKHRTAIAEADLKIMQDDPDLRRRVNVIRSTLPAITHVDYSARLQTVDEARHGRFYRLLREFERQTGCPVLVNTSFNVRGEPIVCTPADAVRCFLSTDMDALVLEDFVLRKEQMPAVLSTAERARHLATFDPD